MEAKAEAPTCRQVAGRAGMQAGTQAGMQTCSGSPSTAASRTPLSMPACPPPLLPALRLALSPPRCRPPHGGRMMRTRSSPRHGARESLTPSYVRLRRVPELRLQVDQAPSRCRLLHGPPSALPCPLPELAYSQAGALGRACYATWAGIAGSGLAPIPPHPTYTPCKQTERTSMQALLPTLSAGVPTEWHHLYKHSLLPFFFHRSAFISFWIFNQ